ncbi:MAG: chemotaxis protein CheA [Actinomycetota bacterium]
MPIDVSRFHQTFFEESFEGLDAMETGLLDMDAGSEDAETINTIFRAAHSIKGGAATLGFEAVASFTHHLETILDRRRSGQSDITSATIDLLLSSVDCLREMLTAAQDGTDLDVERVTELEDRLKQFVNSNGDGGDDAPPTGAPGGAGDGSAGAGEGSAGWSINFAPHPDLFLTGNDPLRILGELAALGDYSVEADLRDLPAPSELDIETCYLSWNVELTPTDGGDAIGRAAIDEVFEWVEDNADITITEHGAEATGDEAGTGDTTVADGTVANGTVADGAAPASGGGTAPKRQANRRAEGGGGAASNSMRVDIEKVDALINMVGELVITQSMLQQLAGAGDERVDTERLQEGLAELESNTRELQASVMQIRMLPISFALSRLPRMVRDLASKLGKQVELEIQGETTELDKTVMEKIGDPLVHLVRNSLDHGIEDPETRVAAGKPEVGTVSISAFHEGGNIVIEIADDGAGIRADKILAKARERGVVADDEMLTDKQVHDLIFAPGFSTAAEVTDVSGRGVGMDVVKRNITDLGGNVELHSEEGKGSTFRIRLPLTLAILDGQLVRIGDQVFIIPLTSIVELLQLDRSMISSLSNEASVYRHRDAAIPLVDVPKALGARNDRPGTAPAEGADEADPTDDNPAAGDGRDGLAPDHETGSEPLLVVVDVGDYRMGLIVDDLLAQQQIVIKSLTTNFRAVPGLFGATILGDGTVAMIIDVNSVLELCREAHADVELQAVATTGS